MPLRTTKKNATFGHNRNEAKVGQGDSSVALWLSGNQKVLNWISSTEKKKKKAKEYWS